MQRKFHGTQGRGTITTTRAGSELVQTIVLQSMVEPAQCNTYSSRGDSHKCSSEFEAGRVHQILVDILSADAIATLLDIDATSIILAKIKGDHDGNL